MADYYKGSPGQDVRDYSGKKKKKKPVYEQGTIPNLFGHGKEKAQAIDAFRSKTSLNGQVNDNIA